VEKLLVTGVDSILGSNVALALADRYDVFGLYQHHPLAWDGCPTGELSVAASVEDIQETLARIAPKYVVHCGAIARSSWEDGADDPDLVYNQDVRFALDLASACETLGCHFTVMSTDAVFMGPRLFHSEQDRPEGECLLASAAQSLERQLLHSRALILRTHAYGWSPFAHEDGYAQSMWRSMNSSQPCRVDADRHATPILATDLADLLARALEIRLSGLHHVTGAERVSPFKFAAEMARAFGLNGQHLHLEVSETSFFALHRPCIQETSLNTRRARRILKAPMPMLREGLSRFAEQLGTGFRARIQASQWAPSLRVTTPGPVAQLVRPAA